MTTTYIDREVLAVLTALRPLAQDGRLGPVLERLNARREFDVEEVLDNGWSSGERALIEWAGALWAGHGQIDIGYIASGIGDRFLHAALGALAAYSGRPIPAFDSLGDPVTQGAEAVETTRGCDACRVLGPLLTAPGTSGRTWTCDCGTSWAPNQ